MSDARPLPWSGFFLAAATTAVLLASGLSLLFALLLLGVWIGTLWLSIPSPVESKKEKKGGAFSREGLAEMIEHSGTPLMLTERNRIIIANRAARDLLGSYILGQDARVALRHPEAIALMDRSPSGEALITGLARPKDIWQMRRNEMEGRMAVIELVSRTAEADISRAHTDFVANASHELRTPLASIIGYVETLSEDACNLEEPRARRFLSTIHSEARRLQSLVSDLMSLSRIEAEKHERPDTPVHLNPLIKRSARDAASTAEHIDRLRFEFAGDFTIPGDPQQIEQLIRNLVENAVRYGSEDGTVTISLSEAANGDAKIEVCDQGDGIPAEHIPHLTRRFYRTDPGRSRASGGTGLGLAIVKHIVQRHRGRLDIQSEIGIGTTVIVRIPVLKNSAGAVGPDNRPAEAAE